MSQDRYQDVPMVLRPRSDSEVTQQIPAAQMRELLSRSLRPASSSQQMTTVQAEVTSNPGSMRPSLKVELSTVEMQDEPLADSVRGALLGA